MEFKEALAIVLLALLVAAYGWIVLTPFRDRARYARGVEARRLLESADAAAQNGQLAEALNGVREAERKDPGLLRQADWQASIATICLAAGEPREAIERIHHALRFAGGGSVDYPGLIDGFCTGALMTDAAEVYPGAEKLIRRAIKKSPTELTLKGTLGSLLFEMGRVEEAAPLLELLHKSPPDEMNRGIAAAYLSAIAGQRGDEGKARELREEALKVLPEHAIVRRVLGVEGEKKETGLSY